MNLPKLQHNKEDKMPLITCKKFYGIQMVERVEKITQIIFSISISLNISSYKTHILANSASVGHTPMHVLSCVLAYYQHAPESN